MVPEEVPVSLRAAYQAALAAGTLQKLQVHTTSS